MLRMEPPGPSIRRNAVRRSLLVATAMLILSAAGCSRPAGSAAPVPAAGSPAADGSAVPTSSGGQPPGPSATATTTSPTSAPTASPGGRRPSPAPTMSRTRPAADPEIPNDRVGAPIVLTGTVDTGGTCVTVTVGAHRWALVGASTGALEQGQKITVRGRPVALPAGCRADFALAVRNIT